MREEKKGTSEENCVVEVGGENGGNSVVEPRRKW